jgi:esterase/lipase superfamily enzyme
MLHIPTNTTYKLMLLITISIIAGMLIGDYVVNFNKPEISNSTTEVTDLKNITSLQIETGKKIELLLNRMNLRDLNLRNTLERFSTQISNKKDFQSWDYTGQSYEWLAGEETAFDNQKLASLYGDFEFDWRNSTPTISDVTETWSSSKYVVPVYFGTDRKGLGDINNREYTAERNYTSSPFEYGLAHVHIPKNHVRGELERPFSFFSFSLSENPDKHIVIVDGIKQLSKKAFIDQINTRNLFNQDKHILMFIHGYNVEFSDAILRTGQLSFDLGFKGTTVAYSWPSEAEESGYMADGEEIKLTRTHLKQFINDLKKHTKIEKISVIAHSMGSRAFTEVMKELAKEQSNNEVLFHQVVLAAPDIDAKYFETEIAPVIVNSAKQLTLYASATDNVLEFSSKLRKKRSRAGEVGDSIVIVKGIDTIDASSTNNGFFNFLKFGHSYYGDKLLEDLYYIINSDLPPNKRFLIEEGLPPKKYWIFGEKVAN